MLYEIGTTAWIGAGGLIFRVCVKGKQGIHLYKEINSLFSIDDYQDYTVKYTMLLDNENNRYKWN